MKKFMSPILLVVSGIGLFDAVYLSAEHFAGRAVTCSILGGCEAVTSSDYATIFGIPVALFGAIFYFTIFILSAHAISKPSAGNLRRIAWITPIGFVASVWFVYVQVFILNAYCFYCMISASTSTILFIIGMIILHKYKRDIID